jgi:hypothetical protein
MTQETPTPPPPVEEPGRNSNVWIIVIVIAVILLCCCLFVLAIWYLWTYGDQIFGLAWQAVNILA